MSIDPVADGRVVAFANSALISALKRAARLDEWDGRRPIHPMHRAVAESLTGPDVLVSLLLTFDRGAHSSGWWRNSDYEICWHLSMVGMAEGKHVDIPDRDRRAWPHAVFGEDAAKAWWEPPAGHADQYRNAPASTHTWHVRLFLDRTTGRPIIPTGEVYTLKPWAEGDSPEKVFR